MQAEYDDGLETLGRREMVFYKFLSLFRAKGTDVSYGGLFTHANVDPEIVDDIRGWLKQQKEWVRSHPPVREMTHRMWWLVQKLMDYKLFDGLGQRHILFWYDSCIDAITTP